MDDRAEQLAPELVGVPGQRSEQVQPRRAVVGPAVAIEPGRGGRERALEDDGPPLVEGMGDRGIGVDELDAVRRPVDRPEERRGERERHDRRAHVVAEPGERQLRGPGAATDRRSGLVDTHRATGPSQRHGRGQTVRTRTDDDGVERRSTRPGHWAAPTAPAPAWKGMPAVYARSGQVPV